MSVPIPKPGVDLLERDFRGRFTGKMAKDWYDHFLDPAPSSGGDDMPVAFGSNGSMQEALGMSGAALVRRAMQRGNEFVQPAQPRTITHHDSVPVAQPIPQPRVVQLGNGVWLIQDTAANIANYPASLYNPGIYFASDTSGIYRSDGTAWTQVVTSRYTPLFDYFADAGNVGTGEDDLYSSTLAAGQLDADGAKLETLYAGTFALSATATRQLRVYFGGSLIFDSGALSITGTNAFWSIFVEVIRESSSVIRATTTMTTSSAALVAYTAYQRVTGLTLANTQVVKITGEAAGVGAVTNDIIAKQGYVAYSKAA